MQAELSCNCHASNIPVVLFYAAHDGKVKERISDYNKISTGLSLPKLVIANQHATPAGKNNRLTHLTMLTHINAEAAATVKIADMW